MNFSFTTFLLLFSYGWAYAQTVNRAEYFFDSDPGPGNGTAIAFAAGDPVTFTTTISTTGLSPGYHLLYLRTRTSTGKWSLYEPQEFVVDGGILAAEYFFDTDPGIGGGTPLPVTPVTSTITPTLSTSSLPDGVHYLYVRTRHDNNVWSLTQPQRFVIRTRIVSAEYFIDTDPGFGNGTPLTIATPSDLVNINTTIVTTALADGTHNLFVRTLDIRGKWSLYEPQPFTVDSALPIELLQFTASLVPRRQVRLRWTTVTEINNDYFTVQHSLDGHEFAELEKVPGSGTRLSEQLYETYHRNPATGSNYYRLKQTDHDGKTTLSRIVAVEVPDNTGALLYPNPTAGDWFVDFSKATLSGTRRIELLDLTGRMLMEKMDSGNSILRFTREDLSAGTYLLRIVTDEGIVSVQKIVLR